MLVEEEVDDVLWPLLVVEVDIEAPVQEPAALLQQAEGSSFSLLGGGEERGGAVTWVIMATSSRDTISHETEVVRYFAMYINLYINFLVWVLSFLSWFSLGNT